MTLPVDVCFVGFSKEQMSEELGGLPGPDAVSRQFEGDLRFWSTDKNRGETNPGIPPKNGRNNSG